MSLLEFITCPISKMVFSDPVIADDSITYERECIEKWFQQSNKSPINNSIISRKIIKNLALQNIIDDLVKRNEISSDQIYKPKFDITKFNIYYNDDKYMIDMIDRYNMEEHLNNNNYIEYLNETNYNFPIHCISIKCSANVIIYAIKKGISINCCNKLGFYPIHYMLKRNLTELTKFCIDNKIDIDRQTENCEKYVPLYYICEYNSFENIIYAYNAGIDFNQPCNSEGKRAINYIVERQDLTIENIDFIIKNLDIYYHDVSNNEGLPIYYLLDSCNTEQLKYYISEGQKGTFDLYKSYYPENEDWSLIHYIFANDYLSIEDIEFMISVGIDMNIPTKTLSKPINIICRFNKDPKVLEYVLKSDKFDKNVKKIDGSTLFFDAFQNFYFEIHKLILDMRLNFDMPDDKFGTPIDYLCTCDVRDHTNLIKYAIDIGIPFDIINNNTGLAPIHELCKRNKEEIIKYAIDKKINFNIMCKNGWYPVHYIFKFGSLNIIQYVCNNGIDYDLKTSDGLSAIKCLMMKEI